jgi:C-terminal processing protease CtpA/Prc
MKTYEQMFDEIIQIMKNDYSGKDEKNDWDEPNKYIAKIKDTFFNKKELDDNSFYEHVFEYLMTFKDLHILWRDEIIQSMNIGFDVKRYEDKLYITEVLSKELPLEKGMTIIEIDGKDIAYYMKRYQHSFLKDSDKIQHWQHILRKATMMTVKDKANVIWKYLISKNVIRQIRDPYEIKKIADLMVYLRFDNFVESEKIQDILNRNKDTLESAPYWIIDVRKNNGGSDIAYASLLPYLFSKKETITNEDTYLLMSERNCKLRVEILENYLNQYSQNNEAKVMIKTYLNEVYQNWGKGFIKQDQPNIIKFDQTLVHPKKVCILTDVTCSSSGEQFVLDAKQAKKVHVLGRPTLGVLDYSNLAKVKLNHRFTLWYPTSKTANTLRHEFTHQGIMPHTLIPWSPAHIDEDIDLIEAIKLLNLSS